jgi:hypothetical protein
VPVTANSFAYVVREIAAPLHLSHPVGAVLIVKNDTWPMRNPADMSPVTFSFAPRAFTPPVPIPTFPLLNPT